MNRNIFIYQQFLLLTLKDEQGTVFSGVFYQQALAGYPAVEGEFPRESHESGTQVSQSRREYPRGRDPCRPDRP